MEPRRRPWGGALIDPCTHAERSGRLPPGAVAPAGVDPTPVTHSADVGDQPAEGAPSGIQQAAGGPGGLQCWPGCIQGIVLTKTTWLLSIESSSGQQQQQPPPRPWQSELAAARTREQAKDTVWARIIDRPMYVQSYSRTYTPSTGVAACGQRRPPLLIDRSAAAFEA